MSCVFNDTIAECRRPYTLGANMCSCVVGYMWSSRSILPCCFGLAKSVWAPSKHGRLQRPRRQMVNPLKLQRMNGDGIEIFRGEATLGWTWRGLSEWWPGTCQQAKRSSKHWHQGFLFQLGNTGWGWGFGVVRSWGRLVRRPPGWTHLDGFGVGWVKLTNLIRWLGGVSSGKDGRYRCTVHVLGTE
jgi:hypothetical protein